MSEAPRNDIEDKKIQEKPDAIKKQEDIAQKYPDLNAHEKGVLAGLDIKFDKQKGMNPEEINKGMASRFDSEIAKAGQSGEKQDLLKMKEELSGIIENTPDMKQKIALYEACMTKLNNAVSTNIAEQKQRADQNAQNMKTEKMENKNATSRTFEEKLNRMQKIAEEIKKMQGKEKERQASQQSEEIKVAIANMGNVSGWPGDMPQTKNA